MLNGITVARSDRACKIIEEIKTRCSLPRRNTYNGNVAISQKDAERFDGPVHKNTKWSTQMKRALASCVLASLLLTVVVQAKDDELGGTERAVAALEQKWVDAAKASNPDMLAPLLAFNFVSTSSDGKVMGKEETLAHLKAAKWETNQISDVKVTAYGKTAIATGIWVGKGTDENGKTVDTRARWTDTWIKLFGGNWQCVASHSSTIKM
jgi:ketosteroid isomerase-like protein